MWVFTLTLHSEPRCVCGHFPEEEMTAPHTTCVGMEKVLRWADSQRPCKLFHFLLKNINLKVTEVFSPPGLRLVVWCIRGHPGRCPCYVDVLETQDKDNSVFKAPLLMTFDFEI